MKRLRELSGVRTDFRQSTKNILCQLPTVADSTAEPAWRGDRIQFCPQGFPQASSEVVISHPGPVHAGITD